MKTYEITTRDPIIDQVIQKILQRSAKGFETYHVTMAEHEKTLDEWLNDIQEELMDAVNYIEKTRTVLRELGNLNPAQSTEQK